VTRAELWQALSLQTVYSFSATIACKFMNPSVNFR